jgi:LacI family transcriptional regulator
MSDVATLARVSLTTVSRVINGVATVDAELAARVHRAAEALDFRPNLTASSLRRRGGRTRTIGLLLENVANPFSSTLYRAVEDVARGWGVGVLAASVDEEPARERELALNLVARRVDGLIIVPTGDDQSYLITERRAGVSVVFADRPPRQFKADCVVSDNHNGAMVATKHLIAGGHRRIGFLGDLVSIQTSADRMAGYVGALRDCGIPKDPGLMRADLHSIEAAEAAAHSLLRGQHGPTALFAAQNLVTIGAMRALRTLGLQHRVALVGFDNFLLADLLEPAVTVVAQDPSAMGELAAEILFRRMDGDESPPREHVVPTQLIVRGSGEIPPP